GHVTLELSNVANLPVTIYPEMKIGQISFVQLTEPARTPYGTGEIGSKYQGQRGPTPSRYWQNFAREAKTGALEGDEATRRQFGRIMVEGTRDLLAAAGEAGVRRFVHMSALGTSEETKDLVPYYGAKWENEQNVRAAGIPYVIFRPSFVFGTGGGILPTFVKL